MGGVTSQRPVCSMGTAELCGNKSQHIQGGEINNVPIKNCNYTNIYQIKDFFFLGYNASPLFLDFTTNYYLIFPSVYTYTTPCSCIVFKCTNAPFDPFKC